MTDYIPRSFARFLRDVVPLDSSGNPYEFGFEFCSLIDADGYAVILCECCNHGGAYYKAVDDTFWCIMCWRNRQAFGTAHQRRRYSEGAG